MVAVLTSGCTTGDSEANADAGSGSADSGSGSTGGSSSATPTGTSGGGPGSGSAGTESPTTGQDTEGAEGSTANETGDTASESGGESSSGGERLPPDDTPGELSFETPSEIEGGWYQYYQGSVQYRPSGEVFAVAVGGGVTHVVNDSSSSSNPVVYRSDAEGAWAGNGNVTDPDFDYVPRSLAISLDTDLLPSIGVGGIHYVNYPSSMSSAHAYSYDGYLWNFDHPAASMSGPAPRSLEMVVDNDNRRHVLFVGRWEGNDDTLIYASADEAGWVLEPVATEHNVTSLTQKSCALAVDPAGDVHVVYSRDNPAAQGNESDTVISYARRSGDAAWEVELVEDYLIVRDRVDIAVGPDGTPHIVMAEDMFSAIWHTSPVDGAWEAEVVDDVGDVGWGHAIAVDDFGRPHLSYVDRQLQQIRYARRISSGWDRYAPTESFPDSAGGGGCGYCRTDIATDLGLDGTQPVIVVGGFDLSVVRATLD